MVGRLKHQSTGRLDQAFLIRHQPTEEINGATLLELRTGDTNCQQLLFHIEANSSYLWNTELRPANAGTWEPEGM
jgi:hypothetical protein